MNKQRLYYLKTLIFGYKRIINKNKKYLKNGLYAIKDNFCTIYNIESDASKIKTFIDLVDTKENIKKKINRLVTSRKYKLSNNESLYNGEMIIVSSARDHYKIFDFDNELLITRYNDEEKYNKVNDNYKYLRKMHFKLPDIIEFSDKELITVEKYIVGEDNTEIKNHIFKLILKDYISVGSNFEVKNNSGDNEKNNLVNYDFFERLDDYINSINDISKYSKIKCHGDLWSSNIIYSNKNLYYIDYEMVGYYSFYYDIYFFMFSEAYILNNYDILNNYFLGEYDDLLQKYFSIFGAEYDKNLKKYYLVAFVKEYAYNKWRFFNKRGINYEISRLNELFIKLGIRISGEE